MSTITRRRGRSASVDLDPQDGTNEGYDEAPRRSRSRRTRDEGDSPEDEPRSRRSRSRRDDEGGDEDRGSRRGRSASRRDEGAGEDRPSRGSRRRSRGDDEAPRGRRGHAARGFDAYRSRKRSTGNFGEEYKPSKDNEPSLIKLLEAEPFDSYHQHWIDEVPKGTRKSYVCFDDEYFEDDPNYDPDGCCPLCEIGDPATTYALWNVLNLENPRKPKHEIWKTSPTVTDDLIRMSEAKRTSPLNREDLYLEVTRVKKGNNTRYKVEALKAEDAEDEYEFDAFTAEELEEYEADLFDDRKAYTQVDTFDALADLADEIA